MSNVLNIADALVAELNAAPDGTFSKSFVAVRKVIPAYELSELAELKVTVVPKAIEITSAMRNGSQHDFAVDIGIQQKISKDVDTDVESLMSFVDEIAAYLTKRKLMDVPWAQWVSIKNEPPYVPEHLAEKRTFTSVLTLTYRGFLNNE